MVTRTILSSFVALCLFAACHRGNEPAAASRPGKTTTVVIPQDMKNARINETVQPDITSAFLQSSTFGDQLAADGSVATENDVVTEGRKLYFTMRLRESPKGLQTRAVWRDAVGRDLSVDERAMGGTTVVTFPLKNALKPGRYSVTGYWGGNVAAEHRFEVIGAKSAKKKQ